MDSCLDQCNWTITDIASVLPPYTPVLNPAEKIGWIFKRDFSNQLFKSMDELDKFMALQAKKLSKKSILKTCRYKYIFSRDLWSNI